jgi:hypothetical protein
MRTLSVTVAAFVLGGAMVAAALFSPGVLRWLRGEDSATRTTDGIVEVAARVDRVDDHYLLEVTASPESRRDALADGKLQVAACDPGWRDLRIVAEADLKPGRGNAAATLPLRDVDRCILLWDIVTSQGKRSQGSLVVGDRFVELCGSGRVKLGYSVIDLAGEQAVVGPAIRLRCDAAAAPDVRSAEIAIYEVRGADQQRQLVHRWTTAEPAGCCVDFAPASLARSADHVRFEIEWRIDAGEPRPFAGSAWML